MADFLVVYIGEAHPSDGWRWNVSDIFYVIVSDIFYLIVSTTGKEHRML